jgi:hypothetical protein
MFNSNAMINFNFFQYFEKLIRYHQSGGEIQLDKREILLNMLSLAQLFQTFAYMHRYHIIS